MLPVVKALKVGSLVLLIRNIATPPCKRSWVEKEFVSSPFQVADVVFEALELHSGEELKQGTLRIVKIYRIGNRLMSRNHESSSSDVFL